jgi:hypothetical protein
MLHCKSSSSSSTKILHISKTKGYTKNRVSWIRRVQNKSPNIIQKTPFGKLPHSTATCKPLNKLHLVSLQTNHWNVRARKLQCQSNCSLTYHFCNIALNSSTVVSNITATNKCTKYKVSWIRYLQEFSNSMLKITWVSCKQNSLTKFHHVSLITNHWDVRVQQKLYQQSYHSLTCKILFQYCTAYHFGAPILHFCHISTPKEYT